MRKIGKFLIFLFILSSSILFLKEEVFALDETEIKPNKTVIKRLTEEKRSVTYKITIDKEGYQYYQFRYEESDVNRIGKGFIIKVFDTNKKLIHTKNVLNSYTSETFGIKKKDNLYVEITENFDYIDPLNGINFTFQLVNRPTKGYEKEDNDSLEKANVLKHNLNTKGNLHVAGDVDYFIYEIPFQGKTKIHLSATTFNPDMVKEGWKVEILDIKGRLLTSYEYHTKSFVTDALKYNKKQKIILKVSSKNPSEFPELINYSINLKTSGNKNVESEDNNSFKKANTIKNKKVGFLVNDEDKDFFLFKANKTKKYSIKLLTGELNDLKYQISFFKKKNERATIDKVVSENSVFSFKLNRGEKLWIKVFGNPGTAPLLKDYTLKIR